MAQPRPEEWSFEQRAAVAGELDQQLVEVIERLVRLSRELLAETSVADYLVSRKIRLGLAEDELSF
jgi:hypothetical protein